MDNSHSPRARAGGGNYNTETPKSNRSAAATSSQANYAFYDENYKPMWKRGISRKIGESAFVQQTLPTYRVSWNAVKVCPFLLLLGAFFGGMGVGIKKFSHGVKEVNLNYTYCTSLEKPETTCYDILKNATSNYRNDSQSTFYVDANDIENCTCLIEFTLEEPLQSNVYIYYALQNFYQNHLDHYQSRDETQLKGNVFDKKGEPKEPSYLCGDLRSDPLGRYIYPCGLMANSMFTDVIDLYYYPDMDDDSISKVKKKAKNFRLGENETIDKLNSSSSSTNNRMNMSVPVKRTGIAWESDKEDKYNNPDEFFKYPENDTMWQNFTKPPSWKRSLWHLDPTNSSNNGVQNEDFIVWMRTAAFPWFRKLYRIVERKVVPFQNGLPEGNYSLLIQYNYDVSGFDGGKEIILTTSKMVGAKNMFLAIAYMSTGAICIFLAIVLFIVYYFCGSLRFVTEDDIKKD